MSKKSKKVRHILSLSGGSDALSVCLKDKIPDLELEIQCHTTCTQV